MGTHLFGSPCIKEFKDAGKIEGQQDVFQESRTVIGAQRRLATLDKGHLQTMILCDVC